MKYRVIMTFFILCIIFYDSLSAVINDKKLDVVFSAYVAWADSLRGWSEARKVETSKIFFGKRKELSSQEIAALSQMIKGYCFSKECSLRDGSI